MNDDADLAALAALGGVLERYGDLQGQDRVITPETQRALLTANGIAADSPGAVRDSLAALHHAEANRWFPEEIIVESGQYCQLNFGLGATWTLHCDDTGCVCAQGPAGDSIALPPLASGVYELRTQVGARADVVRVLVAPRRLPPIETLMGADRLWGVTLALYGLRSDRNGGLGDFDDLARMAEIAGAKGAGFVGLNPIHSMGYASAAFSPYSPSHRGFLNTAHIALDAIPGLEDSVAARAIRAGAEPGLAALRDGVNIDYQAHKRLHQRTLEALFAIFETEGSGAARAAFDAFVIAGAEDLNTFAIFEGMAELHGMDWRQWSAGTDTRADATRERFHCWLQWIADSQLADARVRAQAGGLSLGLYLDLAVGPRRDGAESWCAQDIIAQGVSIGAPPDHLSPEGQNWDLAAFAPRKLQAVNYRPLRRIIAQVMRHAGVVRIDHVLGLNRSFWIPDDGSPGGYIRQPFEALLAIIKIEAERYGCTVVGEDLGLVPEGFRETINDHGFYGYSVLQYEKDHDGHFRDPAHERPGVLACFSTHDTPTVKGFELGRDIEWWQRLGWMNAEQAGATRERRADDVADFRALVGTPGDFSTSVSALLAGSPAALVSLQLDDILGLTEAQNLPGTIDQHPNWRRKYPLDLNALDDLDALNTLSRVMDRRRATRMEEV